MGEHTMIDSEEIDSLRSRLAEAEDMLRAIRAGEVDAIVVQGAGESLVYTLKGAADPYRLLVEQMSEGALTVSSDGLILYCNDAFARMIGRSRERLIGTMFLDLVFERACETQLARRLLADPGYGGLSMQLRNADGEIVYAQVSSAPLVVDGENLNCLVVTDLSRQPLRVLHEAIVDSSADAIYAVALDGTIESWNRAAERLFGYSPQEAIGNTIFMLAPPSRLEETHTLLARLAHEETIRLETRAVTKQGRMVEVSLSLSPIGPKDGDPGAIAVIARDITEIKRSEARKQLLLAEVNHRSRNLLSVVQAIAKQTARKADPTAFAASLTDRIASLAANQDLLIKSDWGGVETAEVVRAQLSHFDELIGVRILIEGPSARLTPAAAQGISMALHELATNAAKYGALSNRSGRVYVLWRIESDPEPRFQMQWLEEGGPKVSPPARTGFGQMVIGPMTEALVEGRVTVDFQDTGVRWALSALACHMLEET
jgi:PAS domain S-box-containing protein